MESTRSGMFNINSATMYTIQNVAARHVLGYLVLILNCVLNLSC
jgi:hypothetical protein